MTTAKHTSGRMTFGEAEVRGVKHVCVGVIGATSVTAITGLVDDPRVEQSRADARRIAACWNACEGIPTERLDAAAGETAPIFELLMKTTEQRDELLEALKEVVRISDRKHDAWDAAKAAIAKATGGAA